MTCAYQYLIILAACFSSISTCTAAPLNGSALSLYWIIPFSGVILSLALCPLVIPRIWHKHYGKIAFFWGAITVSSLAHCFGFFSAFQHVLHILLEEYIPFLSLLTALYIITNQFKIDVSYPGTPTNNTLLLSIGALGASIIGTTGASMLLIYPLLSMNQNRRHKTHTIVFFIFLVSNIGGSLSPLGDPPLFIGYLKGIPFFWPLFHLFLPFLLLSSALLFIYFLLDLFFYKQENLSFSSSPRKIHLQGKIHLWFLGLMLGIIIFSSFVPPKFFEIFGLSFSLNNIVRSCLFVAIAFASLTIKPLTKKTFSPLSWAPIIEITKIFLAIFVTVSPVLAILQAGSEGALNFVSSLVTDGDGRPINALYFWLCGLLSGVLDNAPTYMVFYSLAGGNPDLLTTLYQDTLIAISASAVFMGALTYIGNAPNFMVKSIVEERQISMPSFFGYCAWSCSFLIPLFLLLTWIFF